MRDRQHVKSLGREFGFDLVGVAPARPTRETEFLRAWVERGYAGDMSYIERRLEERIDPRRVLAGAESIVVVGLVYDPDERRPAVPAAGEVSRYAGGEDYHEVLLGRLRGLAGALEELSPRPARTRAYVDTGPVAERVHAAMAGLGWLGKNTCLIHPRLGSYLFLGVVLTELRLAADERTPDRCGTCRACLDACPTQAFPEPYVLDARRCLAYTTIELRGGIPEALRQAHGNRVFGCDICQEVCPWNARRRRAIPPDPHGLRRRLRPRATWTAPPLAWILGLDDATWREAARGTALRRTRRRGLIRNALVAAGNSGDPALVASVRRHVGSSDPLLDEHARWALARLSRTPG